MHLPIDPGEVRCSYFTKSGYTGYLLGYIAYSHLKPLLEGHTPKSQAGRVGSFKRFCRRLWPSNSHLTNTLPGLTLESVAVEPPGTPAGYPPDPQYIVEPRCKQRLKHNQLLDAGEEAVGLNYCSQNGNILYKGTRTMTTYDMHI